MEGVDRDADQILKSHAEQPLHGGTDGFHRLARAPVHIDQRQIAVGDEYIRPQVIERSFHAIERGSQGGRGGRFSGINCCGHVVFL